MPDLTRAQWEAHTTNIQKMREAGASASDVALYAKQYNISPADLQKEPPRPEQQAEPVAPSAESDQRPWGDSPVSQHQQRIATILKGGGNAEDVDKYVDMHVPKAMQVAALEPFSPGTSGSWTPDEPGWIGETWQTPTPINPTVARIAGGVAGLVLTKTDIGMAVGSELAGQLSELYNKYVAKQPDDKTLGERALDIGENIAWNYGSAKALNLVGKAATSVLGIGTKEGAQRLKDFKDAGITVKGAAGPVTGSATVQGGEKILARSPIGSNIEKAAVSELEQSWNQAFDATANLASQATEKATAGKSLIKGLSEWKGGQEGMFSNAYTAISGLNKMKIDMRPVKALARTVKTEAERGLGDPKTIEIAKKILNKGDDIPFSQARILRSDLARVGRNLDELVQGKASGAAKRLTEAVHGAMETSANASLAPAQFEEFVRINSAYKAYMGTRELTEKIATSDLAAQAHDKAMAGSNDSGELMQLLKDITPPKLWDDVVAVRVRQMGLETPGAGTSAELGFSPTRFLTNWRAMKSKKAKNVLFPPGSELRTGLDRLARVAGYIKEANTMGIPSGTPTGVMFLLAAGGMATGAVDISKGVYHSVSGHTEEAKWDYLKGVGEIAAPLAIAGGGAKLMTWAPFVEWLADGVTKTTTVQVAKHIAKLATIIETQAPGRDLEEALVPYLSNLREMTQTTGAREGTPVLNFPEGAAQKPARPSTASEDLESLGKGMGIKVKTRYDVKPNRSREQNQR